MISEASENIRRIKASATAGILDLRRSGTRVPDRTFEWPYAGFLFRSAAQSFNDGDYGGSAEGAYIPVKPNPEPMDEDGDD